MAGLMTDPAASGQFTHGFLFADLRGYTAYAETRGDAAAADLLDRYRVLVRAVVSELDGAEIQTEGDSFYVVFPSASRAVAAGLAIVARAAEPTPEPGDAIRVGVGIHAGEAEQRAEGYIGTAVNIAARVCALARPGEVLVTDTVRSLTRTSGRYRFVARGRRTLKGISEPVPVFAVEDAAGSPVRPVRSTSRGLPRAAIAALLGLAGVVLAGAFIGIGLMGLGRSASSSPAPSVGLAPTASPPSGSAAGSAAPSGSQAFHGGRLATGAYHTTIFDPTLTFTLPDGWSGNIEIPSFIEMVPFGADDQQLAFMTPSVGYSPCSTTKLETLPGRREDLVAWFVANKGLKVDVAGTVNLGRVEAVELEAGLGDGCDGAQVQPLFVIRNGTGTNAPDTFVITVGPASPIYVIDVGGRTLLALVSAPASVMEKFKGDARTVLSSLAVGP